MEFQKTKLIDNILEAIKIRSKITGIIISQPILKDIERDLCDFRNMKYLGKGDFGRVVTAFIDDNKVFPLAIKITSTDKVDFDSLTEEQDTMKFLNENIIKNGFSPHLPIYICSYFCKDLQNIKSSSVIVMDLMDGGTLSSLLLNKYIEKDDVDVYMLQLFLLLYIINLYFPSFIHKDIFDENIFFRKCISDGYTLYNYGDDLKFYLPNLGLQLVLGDFGMSSFNYETPRDKKNLAIRELKNIFYSFYQDRDRRKRFGDFYCSEEKMFRSYGDIIRDEYFSFYRIPQLDIRMTFQI